MEPRCNVSNSKLRDAYNRSPPEGETFPEYNLPFPSRTYVRSSLPDSLSELEDHCVSLEKKTLEIRFLRNELRTRPDM